jgi:hypothetical protein
MVNATPTSSGAKSATLTVTSDASNNPSSITLSATGAEAVVAFRNGANTADYTGGSFGTVKVGTQAPGSKTFLLKNSGNKTLVISSVALTGANPGDFGLYSGSCDPTLDAGATCPLIVSSTPTSAGLKSASLTVTSNDRSGTDSIPFTVTGAEPVLSFQNSVGTVLDGATVNIGSMQVGSAGYTDVYLKNTGVVPMNVYTVSLGGANSAEFGQTNTCTGAVAAGGSCVVSVGSTPADVGGNSATLTITSDAPAYSHGLSMASTGIQATLAYRNSADTAAVSSANFGNVLVGSTAGAVSYLVKNVGTSPATGLALSLGGANAANFAISATTCGTTLAVNATCSVSVTATPSARVAHAANLVAASNATNPSMSLPLAVTGIQSVIALRNTTNTANMPPLPFGDQLVHTASVPSASAPQQFRVYNNGDATATGLSVTESGTNPGQFTTTSDCGTSLAAGAFCTVTSVFQPTVKQAGLTMTINVNSSAPTSPNTLTASGNGIQGTVSLDFTSWDFGPVTVN